MEENKLLNKKQVSILFINKEREPLLSPKNRKLLSDPMDDNNPITVQVLGICSALAITVQLKPALVMSISVMAVMAASNVIISSFVPISPIAFTIVSLKSIILFSDIARPLINV